MITIIDYGLGNLRSIQNMLQRAGFPSVISRSPAVLQKASKLILPGVGHFRYAMELLNYLGLVEVLNECVLDARVPVLGICLGAQLLGRGSEEGNATGLNWIPMDTVAFDRTQFQQCEKVPHMGWTETNHADCPLFGEMGDRARYYYVHSYHLKCDAPEVVICTAEHGYRFVSGVAHRHIMGVQFHPEKSHKYGMQLLKNFALMEFSA